jgi:hypothetical protein
MPDTAIVVPLRDMHSAAAESYPFEGFGMYPIEISSIRFQDRQIQIKIPPATYEGLTRGKLGPRTCTRRGF